jgi:membrane-associated protease RseP (regulator of RpoE activity)
MVNGIVISINGTIGDLQVTSSITSSTSDINKVGSGFDVVLDIIENGTGSIPTIITNADSNIKRTNLISYTTASIIPSSLITASNDSFDVVLDIVQNGTGSLPYVVKNTIGLVKVTNTTQFTFNGTGSDEIIAINGDRNTDWQSQLTKIRNSQGKELIFTVKRDGMEMDISAAPRMTDIEDGTSRYVLGIINEFGTKRLSPITSISDAAELTWTFTSASAKALVQLPTKIPALWGQTFGGEERDENGLVGVVGVARVSGQVSSSGELTTSQRIGTFILIVASLNIFVGLFNLLPILPLDGGHMAVAIADAIRAFIARLRGRPAPAAIDIKVLTPITAVVFVVLAALTVLLLIADIFNTILLNF